MKNYVKRVNAPYEDVKISENEKENYLAKLALKCQFCEMPVCEKACRENVAIRDINRRVAVGNFYGAKKILKSNPCKNCESKNCEKACIRKKFDESVKIKEINTNINK